MDMLTEFMFIKTTADLKENRYCAYSSIVLFHYLYFNCSVFQVFQQLSWAISSKQKNGKI